MVAKKKASRRTTASTPKGKSKTVRNLPVKSNSGIRGGTKRSWDWIK